MNLTDYIYNDGSRFYFDLESYDDSKQPLQLMYEDGDMVKWKWEGKQMSGILREEGHNLGLFVIENVVEIV